MKQRPLEGTSTRQLYQIRGLLDLSRETLVRRNAAKADIRRKQIAIDVVDNELRRRGEFPNMTECREGDLNVEMD